MSAGIVGRFVKEIFATKNVIKHMKTIEENMRLWNSVEKTNPNLTKTTKISGRDVTSIDAYSQIKRATEIFGSFGNWGLKDVVLSYDKHGDTTICTMTGKFYYASHEFDVMNSIKVSYMTRGATPYLLVDDEYAKKLETNTITKALSRIGFNADVFMGKFDDDRYVNVQKLTNTPTSELDKKQIFYAVKQALLKSPNEEISQMLNEKTKSGELTVELLKNTLSEIS